MDKLSVLQTIELLKQIKGEHTLYDLHVHPFDVIFANFKYHPSRSCKGLFSAVSNRYEPPQIDDMKLNTDDLSQRGEINSRLRSKLCLLNTRRFYPHTGSKVFADQMELCGIDRALLLPVMAPEESGDRQLKAMAKMFNDERFLYGYCVPNTIPDEKVEEEVTRVVAKYKITALKIHPGISAIDLSHSSGIRRVETILNASRVCRLKVVIHGGLSLDSQTRNAVSFGLAKKLQHIDWSLTPETVVIAHGGFHGHSVDDCRENVYPIMSRLFDQYDHLAVDTSGVSFDVLCFMLEYFDQERIVFGSDALYEKQWMALVKLWHAIQKILQNCDEAFINIACHNPSNLFGLERESQQDRVGLHRHGVTSLHQSL